LNFLAFAYRISVIRSIGFSPFQMVFGAKPTLPSDVFLGPLEEIEKDKEEYQIEHTERLRIAHDAARQIHAKTDQSKKDYFDSKHEEVEFAVGDKIMLYSTLPW
jgi:hypothetical protein